MTQWIDRPFEVLAAALSGALDEIQGGATRRPTPHELDVALRATVKLVDEPTWRAAWRLGAPAAAGIGDPDHQPGPGHTATAPGTAAR